MTPTASTVHEALKDAHQRLDASSEIPRLDAEVWLAHVLIKERGWLFAHSEDELSPEQFDNFIEGVEKMRRGMPLPYLLGEWEFFGLPFYVDERVLIPRPETELLVEQAISWLKGRKGQMRAVDVGTGSGCIAIAVAASTDNVTFKAIDISEGALNVAQKNVARHALGERVSLRQGDLMRDLGGKYDLICANLPYIPNERLAGLPVYKAEPHLALDGGNKGLAIIQPFLEQATSRLESRGLLLAEIDASHAKLLSRLAREYFPRDEIDIILDLAGKERLLRIRLKE